MAVRKDFIVFMTMLLTLAVASSAEELIASEAEIKAPFGCEGVETSSNFIATYDPSKFDKGVCGKPYSVTCHGDGAGGDSLNGNPCNSGDNNSVRVIMVGPCDINNCEAHIQLSTDAYDSIVAVENSETIRVGFVPVYKGA